MDWDEYLRDQAANYRKIAESAEDPLVKLEHFELAAVCRGSGEQHRGSLTGWVSTEADAPQRSHGD
jgi:hypothetical protein